MHDPLTLSAYDRDPQRFADDWAGQPPPIDLQALVRRYFTTGPTADIGCGSGRDAAWLAAEGFPTTGFDASAGLLAEAARRHPDVTFRQAELPDLAGIAEGSFTNVLCETVIMHLPREAIAPAVARMVALLAPGGVLYLSWRVTEAEDRRDEHGRLYTAFDPALVQAALGDTRLLFEEEVGSLSSGKLIRRVIAQKTER
ncbi:MAG TPA: class I SAM-dependent methyltransferase [Acidisoma sp.]|nr:class I SAM-dependent methyltransferase [Acidisoma sp.]